LTTKPKKPIKIKPKGSGAVPIPDTVRTIPGYPDKLKYFKVYCSKFYWVRVYINGSYKVRSLKTELAKEAAQLTIKFYEDVLVDKRVGSTKSLKSRSFSQVGHNFLETLKGVGKPSRYRDDSSRFNKALIPHFGEKDIGEITSADVGSLIKKLQIKKLSPATINHYLIVLRKILKYSYDNRITTYIPNFPKIPGKTSSVTKRDYFTQEEYKSLTKAVDELVEDKNVVRGVPVTIEMKYLIQFMINSFIRPSDLRVLKNEHVQVKTNPNESNPKYNKYLLLSHPATKTTDQEVVTMNSC
jgi:integrase